MITEVIKNTAKEFGYSTEYLTEWICDGFAEKVASKVPGAKVCWDCDIDPMQSHLGENSRSPSHCFIVYEGRYYDAASSEGVDDWRELPFFKQHQWMLLA